MLQQQHQLWFYIQHYQFYQITLYYEKKNKQVHKTTFFDSLKIIPFSVDETAEAFKLPISKLTLDYDKPRYRGWKITEDEKASMEDKIQKLTDKYIAEVDTILEKKEKEIMSV